MQKKALTTFSIAVKNLNGKPGYAVSLVAVTGLMAFALFSGLLMFYSLNNGLNSLNKRLGADIAVVPPGHERDYEGMIISGSPSRYYFEKDVERQIRNIPNVEQCTSQFFLASLDSPCCSEQVQIIGIDYDTDFIVKPWISQFNSSRMNMGEIIAGSSVLAGKNAVLTFFDREIKVAAHLAKTGTGMDTSVYINMNTMKELAEAARSKGAISGDLDIENSISAILVKVSPGQDCSMVVDSIKQQVPGAGIIRTQSLISAINANLVIISGMIRFITVILGLISVLILSMLFPVFTLSRKKEFSVLRILGAERKKLAAIVFTEVLTVSLLGAVTGITVSAIVLFPFNTYWSYRMGLPLLMPSVLMFALFSIVTLFVTVAVSSAAAAYSAYKICKAETYETMREGE